MDAYKQYTFQFMPWMTRLSYANDCASGMLYLHSAKPPLLHLDLKSPNLLISSAGQIKVADFGLALMSDGEDGGGKTRGQHGSSFWFPLPGIAAPLVLVVVTRKLMLSPLTLQLSVNITLMHALPCRLDLMGCTRGA